MTAFDTDVLVAGASPTGLLAAIQLRRHSVDCRIIEQTTQGSPYSKAPGVQARTLEVMDLIGIVDAFIRRGYVTPGINLSIDGHPPISIDLSRLDTRFPYLLVLPQHETEEIIEAHLRAHSMVRHALGVPFLSAAENVTVSFADVWLAPDPPVSRLEVFSSPRGRGMILPFRDGSVRVIAIDLAKQGAPQRSSWTSPTCRTASTRSCRERGRS